MKISRDNYESFFIDYMDNNLEEHLVNDFYVFLCNNPDLKVELEMIMDRTLEPENILFRNKSKLYKDKYDLESEFENAAVALIEGDISGKQKSGFKNYLSRHPNKQMDIELFERTKIYPDNNLIYRKKNKLYKQSSVKTVIAFTSAIAAILLLSLIIYRFEDMFYKTKSDVEPKMVTSTEYPKSKNNVSGEVSAPIKTDTPRNTVSPDETTEINKSTSQIITTSESKKAILEKESRKKELIKMTRLPARSHDKLLLNASLEKIKPVIPEKLPVNEVLQNHTEEFLLADMIKEKTKIDEISLNKIAKTGLTLI